MNTHVVFVGKIVDSLKALPQLGTMQNYRRTSYSIFSKIQINKEFKIWA